MTDETNDIPMDDEKWCHSDRDRIVCEARKTLQGAFDHVYVSVADQGRRCTSDHGTCLYTHRDIHGKTLHCAAGHLFTDAELWVIETRAYNNRSLIDVLSHGVLPYERVEWMTEDMRWLVSRLQTAHDAINVMGNSAPFLVQWTQNCEIVMRDMSAVHEVTFDNSTLETYKRHAQETGKW